MRAALDFISKDVKQYMEQNNLDFSDFETAALIYNSWLSVPEKHKRLEELAAETKDANLRKQIMEILSVEKEDIKVFNENTKGFVYVLTQETTDKPCGYFETPELAYAHGLKQTDAFDINKFQIVGQDSAEMRKVKGYRNPYLMGETMDIEELVDEQDVKGLTAWLEYTRDGILKDFWSQEIERSDEDNLKRIFSTDLFTNAFIHIPNPFEKGDIVRLLWDGSYGVVNDSQEKWLEFLKKVDSGKYKGYNFSDVGIKEERVYDKGDICHINISPAFIEKYEPQKGDDDFELLVTASNLLRGRGELDFLLHYYDEYKEKCMKRSESGECKRRSVGE